ncbi:MAG: hypothetical protein WCC17_11635 [Candidatus Nitrosopolaris sp.]
MKVEMTNSGKGLKNSNNITRPKPVASRRDNLKLFNKDFRAVTQGEIPDGSIDLVLALNFTEVSIREDEEGRIHEKLIESASRWLKEGGLLVMYAGQRSSLHASILPCSERD